MIRLVVVDLDNTLYDWVGYYVPAFEAMVSELEQEHGVERERLLDAFRRVHQRHGTSEYAFVLTELDVLRDVDLVAASGEVHPAIAAFRRKAAETLRLYEGVRETLAQLRAGGRVVVAYTDAMTSYADLRLEQLGVADVFDELVATRDHALPDVISDEASYFPASRFGARRTRRHSSLELGQRKPNPDGLVKLMDRWEATSQETIYVGDSLSRDVVMAQSAGAWDVYAAYGQSYSAELWDQLVRVTHWTPEDVEREGRLEKRTITPSYTISSFRELSLVVEELDRRTESATPNQARRAAGSG